MTDITAAIRADLAPAGKLRAGINYGNFILARKDRATGQSSGVAIDLLDEIARRLGAPVEIVAYDSVAVMGDAAPDNVWDIAFLGSDPQREKIMSFTPAYLEIDATYLVPGASPFRAAAEVDREGICISAPARANFELFLGRYLKHARLAPAQGNGAAFELLAAGKVDALAGLTQGLLDLAGKLPGSRVLDGRFMGVRQSIAVPKGREAGLAYLRSVVEEAKASGLVARAIARLGVRGVSVAPPAG
ncbi:MAG: transporter substrate-binding domain-containing protein [Candidatus Accumulibacter sp.]|jgi:polar amino acid transport system substrate-binding protein|nr:transporter substrate-binding domain-containing protein [Accumulibacter sp.]